MTSYDDQMQVLCARTPCVSMRRNDASNLVLLLRNAHDAAPLAHKMAVRHLLAMEGTWSLGETSTDAACGVPYMVPVFGVPAAAPHAVGTEHGVGAVVARYVLATDVPFLRNDVVAYCGSPKLRERVAAFHARHRYRLEGRRLVAAAAAAADADPMWSAGVIATTVVARRPTTTMTSSQEAHVVETPDNNVLYVAAAGAPMVGVNAYLVARTLMDRTVDGRTPDDCSVSEVHGTVRLSTSRRGQTGLGIVLKCDAGGRIDAAARRYINRKTALLVPGVDVVANRSAQYCALYTDAQREDDIAERLTERATADGGDLCDVYRVLHAMYVDLIELCRDHLLPSPYLMAAYARTSSRVRQNSVHFNADYESAAWVRAAVIRFDPPDMPVPVLERDDDDDIAAAARAGVAHAVRRHRLTLSDADADAIVDAVARRVSRVVVVSKKRARED